MRTNTMAALLCFLVLALGGPGAEAQVLTLEEVQALDWSGSIPMKIKAATDGVFDEGPDYWYEDPDPWFNESDVVQDVPAFVISLYNNRQHDLDDLTFLMAYKDGTFSQIHVGDWVAAPGDFYGNTEEPFGPAGNRPGNGETALYNSAEGVVFVRIGLGVAARDTVEVPVEVIQGTGALVVHFDFYGLEGDEIACSCPASHDVTWDTVCFPSATLQETWSKIKVLFWF